MLKGHLTGCGLRGYCLVSFLLFFLKMTTLKMIPQLVMGRVAFKLNAAACVKRLFVPGMSRLVTGITNCPYVAGNCCIKNAATSM